MCDPSSGQAYPRPPVSTVEPGSPFYPRSLTRGRADAAGPLQVIGSLEMLQEPVLGLLCSVRLPGRIMIEALEWARLMKRSPLVVAGGFHSPMEKECFRLMLQGRTRLVFCPARSLARLRVPLQWRPLIASGRLLLLSAVDASVRRASRTLAARRNRFVTALSDALLIPYAGRGSGTERLATAAARQGIHLYTFPGPETDNLLNLGARAWAPPN